MNMCYTLSLMQVNHRGIQHFRNVFIIIISVGTRSRTDMNAIPMTLEGLKRKRWTALKKYVPFLSLILLYTEYSVGLCFCSASRRSEPKLILSLCCTFYSSSSHSPPLFFFLNSTMDLTLQTINGYRDTWNCVKLDKNCTKVDQSCTIRILR